jgi:hypothetical protein
LEAKVSGLRTGNQRSGAPRAAGSKKASGTFSTGRLSKDNGPSERIAHACRRGRSFFAIWSHADGKIGRREGAAAAERHAACWSGVRGAGEKGAARDRRKQRFENILKFPQAADLTSDKAELGFK